MQWTEKKLSGTLTEEKKVTLSTLGKACKIKLGKLCTAEAQGGITDRHKDCGKSDRKGP